MLSVPQLVVTRNWQSVFRDETLECGASIPDKKLRIALAVASLTMGLGGWLLSALAYVLVRTIFPEGLSVPVGPPGYLTVIHRRWPGNTA